MTNEFVLDFDKALTKLSGFKLGKDMFDEQIGQNIDYQKNITIVIPDRVDLIGSSFIQGFFETIVNQIGISGIEQKIKVVSSVPNAKQMIIDNLN